MAKTALLVMDVQGAFVPRLAQSSDYLPRLAKTIAAARPSVVKVIYTRVAFRPGHPEISPSNPTFSAAVKSKSFVEGSPETLIDPSIAPQEGDVLVDKKRVSAFSGSGLDIILSSLGIETVVLAGMSTGGVVLSTVLEASDKDFGVVVLKDLCVDADETLHNTLMDKIFTKRGQVVEAEKWLETLKA
uniref:Putative isochorismatase-family protein n=1 Tax=Diffractella curvata TaxID=2819868 RepID=A0A7R6QM07_9PEZI|nr:ZopL2 [Diffractella curvata]BBU42024.1 putative isochorismatase-family protein [Diffractella curvata]